MNLTTKILLGIVAALTGLALYFYFFRRTSAPLVATDTNVLATQNAQQANQLATLNNQVQDKVGRTELANILQVTQPTAQPTSETLLELDDVDVVQNFKDKLTN